MASRFPPVSSTREPESWWATAAFGVIFLAALIIRLRFLGRPLWTAEAWVANSINATSIREMFYYHDWLQTTPPLFLILSRVTVKLFGLSNVSFRLVPLGFGMLSVVVMALLSRKLFAVPFALLCTALVALSPSAVEYSKELKQYSGDAAATAVILLVLSSYIQRPDQRRFWRVSAVFWVASWLSHTVVMLVPLAVILLCLVKPMNGSKSISAVGLRIRQAIRCIGFLVPMLLFGAVNYLFLIRRNMTPHLLEYWRPGFPRFAGLKETAHFFSENFLGLPIYFFLGANLKDRLLAILSLRFAVYFLSAIVFLAVIVVFWALRFRTNSRHVYTLLFSTAPLLTLAIFNVLHLYPVGTRRVTLFVLPCIALGWTVVAERIWEVIISPRLGNRVRRAGLVVLALVSVCAVTAGAASREAWRPFQEESEDVPAALQYLRRIVRPNDLVYVHASLAQSVRLYVGLLDWSAAPILYGSTGWACCVRDDPGISDRAERTLDTEIQKVRSRAGDRVLWLLFTDRSAQWGEIGRKDPELMVDGLARMGCAYGGKITFPLIALHRFDCP